MAFLLSATPPYPKSAFSVIAFSECVEALFSVFLLGKLAVGKTAIAIETKPFVCFCSLLAPEDT